tara:strand:+ start:493 stop:1086 length:594 start_codon:yes stop_codon:yes gene_type:complete
MVSIIPRSWIDWTVDTAESFGLIGLFIVSATEAALQPVPPDLLTWPMSLGASSASEVMAIVIIATVGSVLGSLAGYWIGSAAGDMVLARYVSETTMSRLESMVNKHGELGVFFAALGPVPFKALAWTAGAGSMPLRSFVFSGTVGRFLRFAIPAFAIWHYGDAALDWFTPFRFLIISLIGVILMAPVVKWLRADDNF